MILLWVAALTAAAGPAGLPMIVGLYLRDELFISSTATGFILLFGGISGAIAGPIFGQLLDNWGRGDHHLSPVCRRWHFRFHSGSSPEHGSSPSLGRSLVHSSDSSW